MTLFVIYLTVFIVSFLLGSIPFGVLISTYIYHVDIKKQGSGNIGSTNVFRVLGAAGGIACFAGDFLKGLAAGLFAYALNQDLFAGGPYFQLLGGSSQVDLSSGFLSYDSLTSCAFMACVWGHVFNPWLKFKGGKGVAVGIGCLFVALGWPCAIGLFLIFLGIVCITKYVSLGSVIAASVCAILGVVMYLDNPVAMIFILIGAVTIIWAHRSNIQRLIDGTESKFSVKKNS